MVVYDPSQRITAQKAMAHPYFQGAQNLLPSQSGTPNTTTTTTTSSKEAKSAKS